MRDTAHRGGRANLPGFTNLTSLYNILIAYKVHTEVGMRVVVVIGAYLPRK